MVKRALDQKSVILVVLCDQNRGVLVLHSRRGKLRTTLIGNKAQTRYVGHERSRSLPALYSQVIFWIIPDFCSGSFASSHSQSAAPASARVSNSKIRGPSRVTSEIVLASIVINLTLAKSTLNNCNLIQRYPINKFAP